MQGPYLRKYGVETTINFTLYGTAGTELKVDAAHASGDTKIMKDEAAEGNTTNAFTDEGQGYSIVLTATEMQAARIVVYVVDQGTKAWIDTAIAVETYGHASAMHAVDLDDSVRAGLTALPNAAADAAGGLPISDAGGLDLDAALAVLTAALAELSQGIPSATPTLSQAIMLLYMKLRNKTTTTDSELGIYNDAGTKIAKATLSDNGTTFTKEEMISGA